MDGGLGSILNKVHIFALLVFILLTVLFCNPAGAYIYDDFNGLDGIDTNKWTIASQPAGLFSETGGRLNFAPLTTTAPTGYARIDSTQTFGPGFFSLEFYNFSSTNMQPPGSHQGAFAALGLISGTNFVRVIRDQNGENGQAIGVFEVNYNVGNHIYVYYVRTDATNGELGLYYDGTTVTFYYKSGNEWQNTGWSNGWNGNWIPGWTSDPRLYIQGLDEYGLTSFSADNVQYSPVPEPSTLILLGAGLSGVIGFRRRRRRV